MPFFERTSSDKDRLDLIGEEELLAIADEETVLGEEGGEQEDIIPTFEEETRQTLEELGELTDLENSALPVNGFREPDEDERLTIPFYLAIEAMKILISIRMQLGSFFREQTEGFVPADLLGRITPAIFEAPGFVSFISDIRRLRFVREKLVEVLESHRAQKDNALRILGEYDRRNIVETVRNLEFVDSFRACSSFIFRALEESIAFIDELLAEEPVSRYNVYRTMGDFGAKLFGQLGYAITLAMPYVWAAEDIERVDVSQRILVYLAMKKHGRQPTLSDEPPTIIVGSTRSLFNDLDYLAFQGDSFNRIEALGIIRDHLDHITTPYSEMLNEYEDKTVAEEFDAKVAIVEEIFAVLSDQRAWEEDGESLMAKINAKREELFQEDSSDETDETDN